MCGAKPAAFALSRKIHLQRMTHRYTARGSEIRTLGPASDKQRVRDSPFRLSGTLLSPGKTGLFWERGGRFESRSLQERVTCDPGDQDRRREGGDSSAASRALRSISDR